MIEVDYDKIIGGSKERPFVDVNYLPAKDLKIGTKVVCLVARLSGNYDSWLQITSKQHGWVFIDGIISKIRDNGERVVKLNEKQIEKWERPLGKEKHEAFISGVGWPVNKIVKVIK